MIDLVNTRTTYEDTYEVAYYDINLDGITIGQLDVMVEDDQPAYVERIDIDPEYQNKGYGTKVLYTLSNLYDGILVAPDNADAQRLYERIGTLCNYEYADYVDRGYRVYEI